MKLLDEYLAIEGEHQRLRQSYLPKLREALPEKKVVRYYQLENKIDAAVDYELAARIPGLVPLGFLGGSGKIEGSANPQKMCASFFRRSDTHGERLMLMLEPVICGGGLSPLAFFSPRLLAVATRVAVTPQTSASAGVEN